MKRALIVAIALLLIYALVAIPAQAQHTVQVSYLIPVVIIPSDTGGGRLIVDRAYAVEYGTCEAHATEATAALRAEEVKLALESGRTQWDPLSFAVCIEDIREILWSVVPLDTTQSLCIRKDNDWTTPCQSN